MFIKQHKLHNLHYQFCFCMFLQIEFEPFLQMKLCRIIETTSTSKWSRISCLKFCKSSGSARFPRSSTTRTKGPTETWLQNSWRSPSSRPTTERRTTASPDSLGMWPTYRWRKKFPKTFCYDSSKHYKVGKRRLYYNNLLSTLSAMTFLFIYE